MQAWRRSLSLGPWMRMMGWMVTSVMALLGKPKLHLPCGEWSVSAYTSYWAWINPIKIQWPSLFSLLFMKAKPKQWPNFKGYYNAQSCNLFISSHLLCPMKRVIEAHEKCGHFEKSPFGSSLECSLLLGWMHQGANGIGVKWIFKTKHNRKDNVRKHKACLVVMGNPSNMEWIMLKFLHW